jgi:DHA1 family multidrug resistance protein-like MFS transporter
MNKRAFVTVCIAIFVAMLGMGIISPLMAIYARDMGASGLWLGIMYSGFSLSRALMQPVCGWFSDKYSRKTLMIIGLSCYTLVSIGYALASTVYTLTAVRLAHGLASALVIPVAQAYIGDLTPKGREGTSMAWFSAALQLGMAVGPILGGQVYDMYNSMAAVFYLMASLAASGLLLLIIFVPGTKPAARGVQTKNAPMRTMLQDDRIKAICIYFAARGILRQSISAFIPLFAVEVFKSTTTEGALLASIYIFTEAISQMFVGPIADRFDRKKMMIFGGLTTAVLALFLSGITSYNTLILLLIPVAILGVIGRVPALAFNVDLGKKYGRMGSSMGITNAAQDMGHVIGPVFTGWALEVYGVGSVFYVGAIAGILVMPLMTYWLYTKQREYVPQLVNEPVTVNPKR